MWQRVAELAHSIYTEMNPEGATISATATLLRGSFRHGSSVKKNSLVAKPSIENTKSV